MCPCDLNGFAFVRKALNHGAVQTPDDDGYNEESQDNYFRDSDCNNVKPNKRRKFFRGEKPSSSQKRLLSSFREGDVTKATRTNRQLGNKAVGKRIASSDIGLGKERFVHEYADEQIQEDERFCVGRSYTSSGDPDCRFFSDNDLRTNGLKEYSLPIKSKSECNVDMDVNQWQAKQKLLADETLSWNDNKQSRTRQNECERCQKRCNSDQNEGVICTAL